LEGSGGMPIAGPVIWSCMMRDWSAANINHQHCIYRVGQKCTKFKHHNFATVHDTVMQFSAKCSGKNSLDNTCQYLNTAIKYSLFCSWQVNYLNTKLTAKYLRQIRGISKVRSKPAFSELRESVLNVSTTRTNNGR